MHTRMAANSTPDELIARQLKHGQAAALDVLMERHYAPLYRYLYRLLHGDRALAEDLAQETFLRALRGIGGYHENRPFKPWLYAIATHLARDHFARAETRRAHAMPDDADDDHPAFAVADEPDAALIAHDEQQAVIAALASLPDGQREVLILHFYHEMRLAEIAAVLNVPVGTVKSRLSIGTARLRERMKQDERTEGASARRQPAHADG